MTTTSPPTATTADPARQGAAPVRRVVVRVGLILLAVSAVVLGGWAALAPRSFYDSFPGFGRTWVAMDGPFNEHLVRDFGNLNLALALVTIVAAIWLTTPIVQATAAAWLVFSVPHTAYHYSHLHEMATVDAVGNVVSLGSAVLLALVVLIAGWRPLPGRRARPA
jgi:hypothetical protein